MDFGEAFFSSEEVKDSFLNIKRIEQVEKCLNSRLFVDCLYVQPLRTENLVKNHFTVNSHRRNLLKIWQKSVLEGAEKLASRSKKKSPKVVQNHFFVVLNNFEKKKFNEKKVFLVEKFFFLKSCLKSRNNHHELPLGEFFFRPRSQLFRPSLKDFSSKKGSFVQNSYLKKHRQNH